MAYKLIAIDDDGTLVTDERNCRKGTSRRCKPAINAGSGSHDRDRRAVSGGGPDHGVGGDRGAHTVAGGALISRYPGSETLCKPFLRRTWSLTWRIAARKNGWFWFSFQEWIITTKSVRNLPRY